MIEMLIIMYNLFAKELPQTKQEESKFVISKSLNPNYLSALFGYAENEV